MVKLSPHFAIAGLFLITGIKHVLFYIANSHLLIFPFMTGLCQWMYMNNHLAKMTLYYDLYKLGKNENHIAAFTYLHLFSNFLVKQE